MSHQHYRQSIGQKLFWLLSLGLGTAFLVAAIPGSTQPILDSNFLKQNFQKQDQNSSDINEILKLLPQSVAKYSRDNNFIIDYIVVVDSYALVSYNLGNNGSRVLFNKKNNRWKIISDDWNYSPENDSSRQGVPKDTAIQLKNQLDQQFRNSAEELQKFRLSWSRQYHDSINFLGRWTASAGSEEIMTLSFFPSTRQNTICVVAWSTRKQVFEVGKVSGRQIKTPTQTFSLMLSQDPTNPDPFTVANTAGYEGVAYPLPLKTWYYNQDTLTKLKACQQE